MLRLSKRAEYSELEQQQQTNWQKGDWAGSSHGYSFRWAGLQVQVRIRFRVAPRLCPNQNESKRLVQIKRGRIRSFPSLLGKKRYVLQQRLHVDKELKRCGLLNTEQEPDVKSTAIR